MIAVRSHHWVRYLKTLLGPAAGFLLTVFGLAGVIIGKGTMVVWLQGAVCALVSVLMAALFMLVSRSQKNDEHGDLSPAAFLTAAPFYLVASIYFFSGPLFGGIAPPEVLDKQTAQVVRSALASKPTFADDISIRWSDVSPDAAALKQQISNNVRTLAQSTLADSSMHNVEIVSNMSGGYVNILTGTMQLHLGVGLRLQSPNGLTCAFTTSSPPGGTADEAADSFSAAIVNAALSLERNGTC